MTSVEGAPSTTTGPVNRLSAAVLDARQRMTEGRAKLRAQHAGGTPGIQVCAALTKLIDETVLALLRAALDEE